MVEKKLLRSRSESMVFGVCGGLAEYFNIDPVWVRLAFAAAFFANGLGLMAYIVMFLVMPLENSTSDEPVSELMRSNGKRAAEFEPLGSREG